MDVDSVSDVGIGVVYEQFMLNRLLCRIAKENGVASALEFPLRGMAGLTGINSIGLADMGVRVTLADKEEHIATAKAAWQKAKRKANLVEIETGKLPFGNSEFDLSYNFAALWHLGNPEAVIGEMCRVSRNVVLVCMPNPLNPVFQARRFAGMLPAGHAWADNRRIARGLEDNGFTVVEKGLLDIPPWPDTVVPIKKLVPFGKGKKGAWRWSMLDYYSGKSPGLKEKAERFAFIEDSSLPRFVKALWAHHAYVVAKRKD